MKKLLTIALVFSAGLVMAQTELNVRNAKSVKYTADGKFIGFPAGNKIEFYGSGDTKVRTLSGHSKEVASIDFSQNNELMASTGKDRTVILWNLNNGNQIRTLTGATKDLEVVAISHDNRFVAAAGVDTKLYVWEVANGNLIYTQEGHTKHVKALAVSHDNKYIATGGGDRNIILRDLSTGEVVRQWQAHKSWVRDLAFSPDSKILASASEDKSVILWDVESGSRINQFKDHKGWVVDTEFSPDGKFIQVTTYSKAVYVYEVETGLLSLQQQTRKPLVAAAFSPDGKGLAVVEEYGTSVKVFDISALKISPVFRFKDENDKTPPQIFVSNPPNIQNNRVRYSQDIIDIKGTAIDESGIRYLKVNGIETPIRDNGNFVIKLPLSMGDNFVTMEVVDVNDNIALKKFVISRRELDGENYVASEAKNYVLIVGINDYEHWPKLNNAVRDANDVASTLIGMYDFDFSDVTVILNEQATRNNIYKTLRSYIERVTPKDNLLVYFSGHGHFDELLNEGYWVPYEANVNADGEYLPNSSILKVLDNVNSQHTFLVADACFSGSLFSEQTRGYVENVEQYRSRWGLASGRLETVSDGAYGNNSPFADAFIEFLKTNSKEKIAVSELVQYVKVTVADRADQTPIGNPLKSLGDEGGEFVFYRRGN